MDNAARSSAGKRDGRLRILLIEDNVIDVRATLRAAEKLEVGHIIDVMSDGDAAIAYLNSAAAGDTLPDLVLLDLNLPGTDGHDVLDTIKSSPILKRIPVVILTSSEDDADVVKSYDLGANSYVTKPAGIEGWLQVFSEIDRFWLTTAKLPPA